MRFGFDFAEAVGPEDISEIVTNDLEFHQLSDLKARARLDTLEKNRGCLFYARVLGTPTINSDFTTQLKLYNDAAKIRTSGGKRVDFPLMVEYNLSGGGEVFITPATMSVIAKADGTIMSYKIYFPVYAADRPFILTDIYDGSTHTFTKKYFTTTSE